MSIWNSEENNSYPELKKDEFVDVLIIGGGITGVSTLYYLRNSNLKVMLVEQNRVGQSTTSNSTGKLSYLQNDLIDKIRNKYNDEIASKYLNLQIRTIDDIVKTIKKEKINCDLEKVDSYLYTNKLSDVDKIKQLEKFLNKNNIKVYHDNIDLIKSKYIINVKNTYIFNPVKFIHGLLKNNKYPIYEKTSIKKIECKKNYYKCYTNFNIIKAKYVVIASHYPYFTLPFLFPIKVSLEKSYISASKLSIKPFSLISYSKPFISLRTYKNNLIYLSNSHFINKNVCDKDNYKELLKKLKDLNLKPDYLWSNTDLITSDGLPLVGSLKNNLLIATAYNTWGLTNGFLAAHLLSDIILNRQNENIKLFNPHRNSLATIENLFKNVDGFAKGFINGGYICPHLGCKLIYNEVEETYDCPCHGSRFNKDGKCIKAPSNKNINIDK